jgi:hypothetical protein
MHSMKDQGIFIDVVGFQIKANLIMIGLLLQAANQKDGIKTKRTPTLVGLVKACLILPSYVVGLG